MEKQTVEITIEQLKKITQNLFLLSIILADQGRTGSDRLSQIDNLLKALQEKEKENIDEEYETHESNYWKR